MSFQYTLLKVASFVLIMFWVFVGYKMYKERLTNAEKRVIGSCPDYWSLKEDGQCFNINNLGTSNSEMPDCALTIDFSKQPWNLQDGLCRKKRWAQKCQLTWDGITNDENICKVTK
jgi:hypothetical protein